MDWVRFLDENNIHYVTRGPNTKRGEISIKCPFCGEEDPSEHLGVNLQNGKWGCHRDPNHRGKSGYYLIKWMMSCSTQQAKIIVRQYSKADPDTLDGVLVALEGTIEETSDQEQVNLEPQFKNFHKIKARGATGRFFRYLQDRGYENPYEASSLYELRCALVGRYKDRIILPVRHNGELYGWTSRALGNPVNAPRYLMSSEAVKATVFNFDHVKKGGERLFIVEGPFDAMRIDFNSCTATCTFGTSPTISQIAILRTLVKKYKQTFVLFDEGANGPARNLAEWIGAQVAYLPEGVKDPGELSMRYLQELSKPAFNGIFNVWLHFNQQLAKHIFKPNPLFKRLASKP